MGKRALGRLFRFLLNSLSFEPFPEHEGCEGGYAYHHEVEEDLNGQDYPEFSGIELGQSSNPGHSQVYSGNTQYGYAGPPQDQLRSGESVGEGFCGYEYMDVEDGPKPDDTRHDMQISAKKAGNPPKMGGFLEGL